MFYNYDEIYIYIYIYIDKIAAKFEDFAICIRCPTCF